MYNKFEDPTMVSKWMSEDFDKLGDTYKLLGVDLAKEPSYTLELTQEELDFVHERCSRKAQRLEEANLRDIPCYRLSWQVMSKISKVRSAAEERPNFVPKEDTTNAHKERT